MHEIAHSEGFKAWMDAGVLRYGECEWINRIRTVVLWLRRRPAAPARRSIAILQALAKTQRQQDGDQKEDSLLHSFTSSSGSLSTLDPDRSCYGVTWTWVSKRAEGQGEIWARWSSTQQYQTPSPPQRPLGDPCPTTVLIKIILISIILKMNTDLQ